MTLCEMKNLEIANNLKQSQREEVRTWLHNAKATPGNRLH